MKRQRPPSDLSSIDLLLDTICNMFGAMLLMAVLVVLLTQTSASQLAADRDQDRSGQIEARSLQADILRLENAVVDLKSKAAMSQAQYASAVPASVSALLDRQQVFAEAHSSALRRMETAVEQRHAAAKDVALLEQTQSRLSKEISDGEAELRQAKRKLLASPASLPKNVRLPHRRGREIGTAMYFVVKGDNAYRMGSIRWMGDPYISGDCLAEPAGSFPPQIRVKPRDGAGTRIAERPDRDDPLLRLFDQANSRTHYVVMFVYDDDASFAAFQRMKKLILEKGYRYMAGPKTAPGESLIVVAVQYHETE